MKSVMQLIWLLLWPVVWRACIFVVLPVGFLFGSYVAWEAFIASPPKGPAGIEIPADESLRIAQIVENGEQIVNNTRNNVGDGVYRRDAHAKTHGCALASFNVNDLHNGRLTYGLFSQHKSYKAWIRFSSGDFGVNSDWKPDARGMAIKVLGVPGKKLLEGEQDATTQDFLMINNPVFFIRNVAEYVNLTTYQSQQENYAYFFPDKNPRDWQLREFRIGLGILKWPPKNLLRTQFYSMAAYRLGAAQFVKFSAKPVACSKDGGLPSRWPGFGSAALRENLTDQLKSGKYCFDFMVQLQVTGPDNYMPVEDATVEWNESQSPYIPVARIEIDSQDIGKYVNDKEPEAGFCENLSFSPWHALPEHEPAGGLNRVRKAVYQNISRYRRCSNGKFFGEPADDGTPVFKTAACHANESVPEVRPGT